MSKEIEFRLGNNNGPCVSIIEKTTFLKFGEHDKLELVAASGNTGPITVFFDTAAAQALFDSPPAQINLLPKTVAAAGIAPEPVDRFTLRLKKDLGPLPHSFVFETEPSARCGPGDLTDVVVEC